MRDFRFSKTNRLARREFITGLTAGVMSGVLAPSTARAAKSESPGVKRRLYVTNNSAQRVDVHDIGDEHKYLRSFPMSGTNVGGICAHGASGRLFITQQNEDLVTAYDLRTETVLWEVNTKEKFGHLHPDRLSITVDGSAVYVPMKGGDLPWDHHVTMVLDAASGECLTRFQRPGRPHNSFAGESGQYMYVAGRSDPVMYLIDQRTHKVVKKIGPFSWPIRPFSVDREERFFYANLTRLPGFGIGDIRTGEIKEVRQLPPKERTRHWSASGGLPHGDHPYSHGIAVRPGAREVWWLDDEWGYLVVHDITSGFAPQFKRYVELFDEIDHPWAPSVDRLPWQDKRPIVTGNRWVAFSIDGRYCYPSDGSVVDAEAGKKTSMRIAPSEKLIEVEFRGNTPVRVSGQMGGVYP